MSENIILKIDGIEYEYSPSPISLMGSAFSIPVIFFKGQQYVGKAIQRDMPNPDWEIVSFKDNKSGHIFSVTGTFGLEAILQNSNISINAVRRISDNEVFSVGEDKVRYKGKPCRYDSFTIHNFHITPENKILVRSGLSDCAICELLEDCEKVNPKVPLFTTEDGVEKYHSDNYITINKDWSRTVRTACNTSIYINHPYKAIFSTSEKAKKYILNNKPIQVSYKELETHFIWENYTVEGVKADLYNFFKFKINP